MLLNDTPEIRAKFWSRVNKDPDGCWEWTRSKFLGGYGQFHIYKDNRGQTLHAHRLAYYFAAGEIPDGLWVLHTCDNPACVRNDDEGWYEVNGVLRPRRGHLWLGTAQDNVDDMMAKGRFRNGMLGNVTQAARGERHGSRTKPEGIRRGEQQGNAKLTEDDVREIRRAYALGGISQTALAARHGVTQGLIGFIVRRVSWKHVD